MVKWVDKKGAEELSKRKGETKKKKGNTRLAYSLHSALLYNCAVITCTLGKSLPFMIVATRVLRLLLPPAPPPLVFISRVCLLHSCGASTVVSSKVVFVPGVVDSGSLLAVYATPSLHPLHSFMIVLHYQPQHFLLLHSHNAVLLSLSPSLSSPSLPFFLFKCGVCDSFNVATLMTTNDDNKHETKAAN